MNPNSKNLWVLIRRRASQVLTLVVLLLWGAFFIEHTREWFVAPFPQLPPLKVCLFQFLHLLLLMGLLVSLRWPRLGLIWVMVVACAFFLPGDGARFLVFFGITILPVFLLVLCDWLERSNHSPA
jgi:hypothetical protein